MNKKIYILLLIFYSQAIAQQSNSSFYPLQTGNKWEYLHLAYEYGSIPDTSYHSKEIIGDTLLPNGINYFRVKEWDRIHFERFDTLTNEIKYYENDRCEGIDVSVYSLNYIPDSTVLWYQCGIIPHFITYNDTTYGIDSALINIEYDYLASVQNTFQKNLGLRWAIAYEIGMYVTSLTGAVINGKTWGIVTSLDNSEKSPTEYELHQNYPNPFNPNTTIKYNLPKSSYIKIQVFDILGNEIEILEEGYKSAGSYETEFDGVNHASGVYIYCMNNSGKMLSKKMLLVK